MQTQKWGKCAWDTFFIFSRNYPEIIDENNSEHKNIKKSTKQFYHSLNNILPCKYCRDSYRIFWKQLNIDEYLNSRDNLTFWLYSLKDLVNKKLIKQEQERFEEQLNALISKNQASKENIEKIKKKIFKTQPSPPFKEILLYYESFRAKCDDKSKSCKIKFKNN